MILCFILWCCLVSASRAYKEQRQAYREEINQLERELEDIITMVI